MSNDPTAVPIKEFTTGVFGFCEDFPICLDATFFPCCQIAYIHEYLIYNRQGLNGPVFWSTCCCDLAYGFNVGTTTYDRYYLRQRYGIAGSFVEDLIISSLCNCCARAQIAREFANRGNWVGGICSREAPEVKQQ